MDAHTGDAAVDAFDDAAQDAQSTPEVETVAATGDDLSKSDIVVRTSTREMNKAIHSSSNEPTMWNKALEHVVKSNEDEITVANIKGLLASQDSSPGITAADMIDQLRSATVNKIVKFGLFRKWDVLLAPTEKATCSFFDSTIEFLETIVPVGDVLSQLDPAQAEALCNAVRLVFIVSTSIGGHAESFGIDY